MNQEPQEGMISKEWGKYLALAAVGLMVAIAIVNNTRNPTESPQEPQERRSKSRAEEVTERGMRNYEPPQRQTERGTVTVRLSGCVSVPANTGYTGALCDGAGKVWVVTPSRPADGTTLTCPAEGFAQRGKRRCTAGGRTFWLEPVR